jgi:NAD(P)-dependent dehydrogenase (short-subunit alcohol dehydrogenase family)
MSWDIKGKYCMVTGASSGIGKEIAFGLAAQGARVFMVCRNAERANQVREDIVRSTGNGDVECLLADLSSQQQVRDLVSNFHSGHDRLHVLVNNAGVIMDSRVMTVDGIEMTFAVNYLAYFMMANLLADLLKAGAPARIINLTSAVHRTVSLDFDNLQGEKKYNRDSAYAQSKLADIVFSYELGRRLEGTDVTVNCVCPGAVSSRLWENSSRLVNGFFKLLMKGPGEGARLPLYLACSQDVEGQSCSYFQTGQHLKMSKVNTGKKAARSSAETYRQEVADRLWEVSERLTGIKHSAAD